MNRLPHNLNPMPGGFPPGRKAAAFSLIEVLVVVTLLSIVVLALMDVFNSTQRAFRSAVTQSDILEGSRAAMDLIATDLRKMSPSYGNYQPSGNFYTGSVISSNAVNFVALDNAYGACSYNGGTLQYFPLTQTLPPGGPTSPARVNTLNYFFMLGRENTKWIGVGYVVNSTNSNPICPLYRFYAETNVSFPAVSLYWDFINAVNQSQWTNMSHILDGVVHLSVRGDDPSGYWMTNYYQWHGAQYVTNNNTWFLLPQVPSPEYGCYYFSNIVPATVELQMAVVEDRTLQRAESMPTAVLQSNYLAQQSGAVHVFRQPVNIPNVDRSAYQ